MTIYMPFWGEYGWLLAYWARLVHAIPSAKKVVCCEVGEEIYYPSASEFIYVENPIEDRQRLCTGAQFYNHPVIRELRANLPRQYLYENHRFGNPTMFTALVSFWGGKMPDVPLRIERERGLRFDVVLAPRFRNIYKQKNWGEDNWNAVAETFRQEGLSVAVVGRSDSCYNVRRASCYSWEFDDQSATLEIVRNARVVVANDTGIAHLSAMFHRPTVVNKDWGGGAVLRMASENVHIRDYWNDPQALCRFAIGLI